MLSFKEWQAGGGAAAPVPTGAVSFADWKAQQGGGGPGGAASPLQDHGTQGAEPLRDAAMMGFMAGNYDPSTGADLGSTYMEGLPASERYGATTNFRAFDVPSGKGVGGWTAKNKDDWYYDPQYGAITPMSNLVDPSNERDWRDMAGPIVMSAVLGGAGLGMLGPVAAGQGAALGAAQAGQGALMNPNSAGGAIGGALGGFSGLPGGSAVGGALGQAAQHGTEGINWGSVLGNVAGSYFKTPGLGQAGGLLYNAAQGKPINPLGAAMGAVPSFAQWMASQGGK